MRKTNLILVFLAACAPGLLGAETSPARLRLPWDQLKAFLNIDHQQVRLSWDEFKQLLAASPNGPTPRYQMLGGEVVLTREEFSRVLNALPVPPEASPGVRVTQGAYAIRLLKDSAKVTATFQVHRTSARREATLDMFPAQTAFSEVTLNGRPARTTLENGRLQINLSEEPRSVIQLTYWLPAAEAARAKRLVLPIRETPITQVDIEIPEEHLDIQIAGARSLELSPRPGATHARAILSPTSTLQLSWNPLVASSRRGPARIYADVDHLAAIEDNAVRLYATVKLQVLQNSIPSLTLQMPAGFTLLKVEGEGLGEWKELPGPSPKLLVPFAYAREGTISFSIEAEQTLSGDKTDVPLPVFTVEDTTRQKGTVGVELRGSAEVTTSQLNALERVDIQELPVSLISQSERPLLYGYRYLAPPASLTLAVVRYPDVALMRSVIDSAEAVTHILREGKRVTAVTYSVRNTGQQFLTLSLPPRAELWSVFVGGEPAKPSAGPEGKVLIPLLRSRSQGSGLARFPVEIVYFEAAGRLWPFGWTGLKLPRTDLLISRLTWSAVTPFNWRFLCTGRRFERQIAGADASAEEPRHMYALNSPAALPAMKPHGSPVSVMGALSDTNGMAGADQEKDAFKQAEESFEEPQRRSNLKSKSLAKNIAPASVSGVLPIRVAIPAQGRTLVFTQTLPNHEKPISLPLVYLSETMITALKVLLVAALVGLLYRLRRRWLPLFDPVRQLGQRFHQVRLPRLGSVGVMVAAALWSVAWLPLWRGLSYLGMIVYLSAAGVWLWRLMTQLRPRSGT